MSRLKGNQIGNNNPTHHATSEEFTFGNIKLTSFDLGGHEQARRVWRQYFPAVDVIIFIVDAADKKRLEEAKWQFRALIMDDSIKDTPILILANKNDKEGAISAQALADAFYLNDKITGKVMFLLCYDYISTTLYFDILFT